MDKLKLEGHFEIIGEKVNVSAVYLPGFSLKPALTVAKADYETLVGRFNLIDLGIDYTSSGVAMPVAFDEQAREEALRNMRSMEVPHNLAELVISLEPQKPGSDIPVAWVIENLCEKYIPEHRVEKDSIARYELVTEGASPMLISLSNHVDIPFFIGRMATEGQIKTGIAGKVVAIRDFDRFTLEAQREVLRQMQKIEAAVRSVYEPFIKDEELIKLLRKYKAIQQ